MYGMKNASENSAGSQGLNSELNSFAIFQCSRCKYPNNNTSAIAQIKIPANKIMVRINVWNAIVRKELERMLFFRISRNRRTAINVGIKILPNV